jgi:transposase
MIARTFRRSPDERMAMSGFRIPEVPRRQIALWSQMLDDALPIDHPARLLDERFDSAAFAPVFVPWERDFDLIEGKPPYHPRFLAMLYTYGLLNRLRSRRRLEAACHNRIDVIWLMRGQKPDHSTMARFVTAHKKRLSELFRKVVRVGIKADLIKMEHHAADGTNIEADAGRGSGHREEKLKEPESKIEQTIVELEREFDDNERREGLLKDGETPWIPPKNVPGKDR